MATGLSHESPPTGRCATLRHCAARAEDRWPVGLSGASENYPLIHPASRRRAWAARRVLVFASATRGTGRCRAGFGMFNMESAWDSRARRRKLFLASLARRRVGTLTIGNPASSRSRARPRAARSCWIVFMHRSARRREWRMAIALGQCLFRRASMHIHHLHRGQ